MTALTRGSVRPTVRMSAAATPPALTARNTAAMRRLAALRAPREVGAIRSTPAVKSATSGVSVAVPMTVGGDRRRGVDRRRLGRGGRGQQREEREDQEGAHGRAYTPPAHLDAQEISAFVIDLQCRVLDPEAVVQHDLEVHARPVAVVVGAHEHVRRQRREAGGHLPHVQVVDLVDAVHADHRGADQRHVDVPRRGLEEDPPGLAQQRPRRPQHHGGDEQRGDPVGAVPAGQQDRRRRRSRWR